MQESRWLEAPRLESPHVRLEPLTLAHAPAIARAAETLDTFRYFPRAPRELTSDAMGEFIAYLLGPAQTVPFCVIDPASGVPSGVTTYLEVKPEHRSLEIGWTWYSPSARGRAMNPGAKHLLLRRAFEDLGALRVQLRTDERNARSRAAILKLGAKFEGILRRNVTMPDAFQRSTAMYSILAEEWADVRSALEARLGAWPARS